jgi:membrane-associated protease RseP (regulator of RpoE activity)
MAGLPKQVVVLVAGVAMNLLAAFLLFFVVAWIWSPGATVKADYVLPNSAAGRAGLPNGIQIESLNGERFQFLMVGDPLDAIRAHAGETVTIGYIDPSGVQKTAVVTLGTDRQMGILGITCQSPQRTVLEVVRVVASYARVAAGRAPLPAPQSCGMPVGVDYAVLETNPGAAASTAINQTTKSLGLILGALGDLGAHIATQPTQAPPGVMGPVGITQSVGLVLEDYGPVILLLLAAILSANLALINILPIPPFDGGKVAIQAIKRVFGVKAVTNYEIATNLVGFVLLFVFLGWITYFDLLRLGGG